MSISASGSGDRKLFVSYISEFRCGKYLSILLPTKRTPSRFSRAGRLWTTL